MSHAHGLIWRCGAAPGAIQAEVLPRTLGDSARYSTKLAFETA